MIARILFFLLLLSGIGVGIAYPLFVRNVSGHEIGSWRVYDRSSGFMSAKATLEPSDAPVRVLLDMRSLGAYTPSAGRTVLTVTAAGNGRTVLAEAISFADSQPRTEGPQVGARYDAEAGVIDSVEAGTYLFTIGPGDAEDIQMRSVDLILRAAASTIDPRAVPAGYILMAIGFVGLVNSLRRGRPAARPEEPPPPKWGR